MVGRHLDTAAARAGRQHNVNTVATTRTGCCCCSRSAATSGQQVAGGCRSGAWARRGGGGGAHLLGGHALQVKPHDPVQAQLHEHNPLLVRGHQGHARALDLLGLLRELGVQPGGVGDHVEVGVTALVVGGSVGGGGGREGRGWRGPGAIPARISLHNGLCVGCGLGHGRRALMQPGWGVDLESRGAHLGPPGAPAAHLLLEIAHALAQLLSDGLVLDVVEVEVGVGHQCIPGGLQSRPAAGPVGGDLGGGRRAGAATSQRGRAHACSRLAALAAPPRSHTACHATVSRMMRALIWQAPSNWRRELGALGLVVHGARADHCMAGDPRAPTTPACPTCVAAPAAASWAATATRQCLRATWGRAARPLVPLWKARGLETALEGAIARMVPRLVNQPMCGHRGPGDEPGAGRAG